MNGSLSGPDGPNAMKSSFLSPSQAYQLRAQIAAYRLLARNQPVPANLGMAAQGKRTDLPNVSSQSEHQQLYLPQGGQNFQRPPGTPAAPLGPIPSPIRPQGYPTQQPITPSSGVQQPPSSAMGPPQSTGAPLLGSTASPLAGSLSAPRPPQVQVNTNIYSYSRKNMYISMLIR